MSTATLTRVCRRWLLPVSVAMLGCVTLAGQQRRDTPRAAAGTGEISGVLSSGDTPPQPVRRAVVTISGDTLPDARSVVTDDAGRFAFRQLPAGTFSVRARKAAYLEAKYGAVRPGRPGSPIALAAGEHRVIGVTIFKGAAISGVLRAPDGTPAADMPVVAVDILSQALPPFQTEIFTTDDRGAYRIYGLMPGEYVVIATPVYEGAGGLGAIPAGRMEAVLADLARRQSAVGISRVAAAPLESPTRPVNFAPVYFPGTSFYSEATRIRLQAGDERDGVSFDVSYAPVATIAGTIVGDVPNLASTELSLVIPGPRLSHVPGLRGITSQPPNERGEFSYFNVAPGRYSIVARARRPQQASATVPPPAPARMGGGSAGAAGASGRSTGPAPAFTGEQLFAVTEVDVRGQEVSGVILQLQPGGTLAGKVGFDASTASIPSDLTAFRVSLSQIGATATAFAAGTRVGTSLSSLAPVTPNPDGTFQIAGVGPAAYTLSVQVPVDLRQIWRLRSATIDGRDLLDEIIEGPSIALANVAVTLTDKRTELSGTFQSASGHPAVEYFMIAFSQDPRHWHAGARRSQFTRPATNGRFVFSDLPPGEYFLAALNDLEIPAWQDPSFLEQAARVAIKLTVVDGQKTVQDVRIRLP